MAQTVLALVLPRRHNQNMGGKKKNRRAESRPTGGADPVVTSTPIEGSEPAVTYLSAPDSRSSQSLADLARGNDATVHLPSVDAGGSGTQVEAGVQPETVFADMIITAPPPDLSTPPVQDAERQVEMFDIRTPPQQRNYIKFTCPRTNRAWHWDVETEDWFFEDEAEQSGWAGYESPRTNRRWWWNEDSQSWFWEKRGVWPM